jgi:hypothetical protein
MASAVFFRRDIQDLFMRKLLFITSIVAATLASSLALAESKQDFQIVNSTGYQIDEVYVSPADADKYGDDILDDDAVPDGGTVNVHFNGGGSACKFDIKVVYEDEDEAEFHNVNLCSISKVTLFWDRKAGTTRAVAD